MTRLRTANPTGRGYRRRASGRGFRYVDDDGHPLERADRERAKALVIPPAWTGVWIAPHDNDHIQAIGTDEAGRAQYLYHPQWRARRDKLKYDRALELAAALPGARGTVTRDLRAEPGSIERGLATAFRLLDSTGLRVGNAQYTKEHGSHGLTTLLGRHVTVSGDTVALRFPGKSGQEWCSETEDAELAASIRSLKHRGPDAALLAWNDGARWRPLHAEDVNGYVRERTRGDFTAKDFRTLGGSIDVARELAGADVAATATAKKRAVSAAIRHASEVLGNTPAVTRSSYVDPRVIDRYERGEVLDTTIAPESALRRLLLGGENG